MLLDEAELGVLLPDVLVLLALEDGGWVGGQPLHKPLIFLPC